MPDDTIYMTPLPANEGEILMEPLAALTGVIYMNKTGASAPIGWSLIGLYTFLGTHASSSWSVPGVGNYANASGIITTNAVAVRLIPRSGWWYQGETPTYRGVLDCKSSVEFMATGNDWNGAGYGFGTASEAAAFWLTNRAEIAVGPDGIFAWGAYDATGGGDNYGALTFYLYGNFE